MIQLLLLLWLLPKSTTQFEIEVSGLESAQSSLYIGVQDEKQFLSNQYLQTKVYKVNKGTERTKITIEGLQADKKVAFVLFQDLNGNKILDKDKLGIPKEPFGFSNNVKVKFSPPTFKEAAVNTRSGMQSMKIQIYRWSL